MANSVIFVFQHLVESLLKMYYSTFGAVSPLWQKRAPGSKRTSVAKPKALQGWVVVVVSPGRNLSARSVSSFLLVPPSPSPPALIRHD